MNLTPTPPIFVLLLPSSPLYDKESALSSARYSPCVTRSFRDVSHLQALSLPPKERVSTPTQSQRKTGGGGSFRRLHGAVVSPSGEEEEGRRLNKTVRDVEHNEQAGF